MCPMDAWGPLTLGGVHPVNYYICPGATALIPGMKGRYKRYRAIMARFFHIPNGTDVK